MENASGSGPRRRPTRAPRRSEAGVRAKRDRQGAMLPRPARKNRHPRAKAQDRKAKEARAKEMGAPISIGDGKRERKRAGICCRLASFRKERK